MNIVGLIAEIESRFHCMVGPPRAYFELDSGINLDLRNGSDNFKVRFVYQSIRFMAWGSREIIESQLCHYLLRCFPEVSDDKPCLFWRWPTKMDISTGWYHEDVDPETGVVIVSNPRRVTRISTRLVIPGYPITEIEEGKETPFI